MTSFLPSIGRIPGRGFAGAFIYAARSPRMASSKHVSASKRRKETRSKIGEMFMRRPHRPNRSELPRRNSGTFRAELTPEGELEAKLNAPALEGWDPVSVWRAGNMGWLQVILRRSKKPKPRG
jgi:hypothetical protein